jgi:hypothetical protein
VPSICAFDAVGIDHEAAIVRARDAQHAYAAGAPVDLDFHRHGDVRLVVLVMRIREAAAASAERASGVHRPRCQPNSARGAPQHFGAARRP